MKARGQTAQGTMLPCVPRARACTIVVQLRPCSPRRGTARLCVGTDVVVRIGLTVRRWRATCSRPAGAAAGVDSSRLVLLERVIAGARKIAGALDPLEATAIIIRECCSVIGADRATIFRLVRPRVEGYPCQSRRCFVDDGCCSVFGRVTNVCAGCGSGWALMVSGPRFCNDACVRVPLLCVLLPCRACRMRAVASWSCTSQRV